MIDDNCRHSRLGIKILWRNQRMFHDVPSDITIEVDGGAFPLHKFPLVSRCGRMRKLVAENRGSDICRIELLNGGGTVQIWRMSDLIYRPEVEVLAELEQYKAHVLTLLN